MFCSRRKEGERPRIALVLPAARASPTPERQPTSEGSAERSAEEYRQLLNKEQLINHAPLHAAIQTPLNREAPLARTRA